MFLRDTQTARSNDGNLFQAGVVLWYERVERLSVLMHSGGVWPIGTFFHAAPLWPLV